MDKTLASNRRRYLQLLRAPLKRDLVTLIDVNEVREHAGVFLVEKPGKTHNDWSLTQGSATCASYLRQG